MFALADQAFQNGYHVWQVWDTAVSCSLCLYLSLTAEGNKTVTHAADPLFSPSTIS